MLPSVYIPGRSRRSLQYIPDESEKTCLGEKFHRVLQYARLGKTVSCKAQGTLLVAEICPVYLLPRTSLYRIFAGNDRGSCFLVFLPSVFVFSKDVDPATAVQVLDYRIPICVHEPNGPF
jgi:hypothetical protein